MLKAIAIAILACYDIANLPIERGGVFVGTREGEKPLVALYAVANAV